MCMRNACLLTLVVGVLFQTDLSVCLQPFHRLGAAQEDGAHRPTPQRRGQGHASQTSSLLLGLVAKQLLAVQRSLSESKPSLFKGA